MPSRTFWEYTDAPGASLDELHQYNTIITSSMQRRRDSIILQKNQHEAQSHVTSPEKELDRITYNAKRRAKPRMVRSSLFSLFDWVPQGRDGKENKKSEDGSNDEDEDKKGVSDDYSEEDSDDDGGVKIVDGDENEDKFITEQHVGSGHEASAAEKHGEPEHDSAALNLVAGSKAHKSQTPDIDCQIPQIEEIPRKPLPARKWRSRYAPEKELRRQLGEKALEKRLADPKNGLCWDWLRFQVIMESNAQHRKKGRHEFIKRIL